MKTLNAGAPFLTLAARWLAVCLGLRTPPRHKTAPPPILLRIENQNSHSTSSVARKTKSGDKKTTPLRTPIPFPITAGESPLIKFQSKSGLISLAMKWIQSRQLGSFHKKRLQVAETVSLGEKRFVAVIQIDGYQYLVGGGATNVALLAKLNSKESFQEILKQAKTVFEPQSDAPIIDQLREKA